MTFGSKLFRNGQKIKRINISNLLFKQSNFSAKIQRKPRSWKTKNLNSTILKPYLTMFFSNMEMTRLMLLEYCIKWWISRNTWNRKGFRFIVWAKLWNRKTCKARNYSKIADIFVCVINRPVWNWNSESFICSWCFLTMLLCKPVRALKM